MKDKILKILKEYSRKKAGYIPLEDREELAESIVEAVTTKSGKTVGELMEGVYY